MSNAKIIFNGIIKENPTFVLLLGMCPTLATTTSAMQIRNVQQIVVMTHGLMDELVLYFGWCFDSHVSRASVFAICSFFKNSTS